MGIFTMSSQPSDASCDVAAATSKWSISRKKWATGLLIYQIVVLISTTKWKIVDYTSRLGLEIVYF